MFFDTLVLKDFFERVRKDEVRAILYIIAQYDADSRPEG